MALLTAIYFNGVDAGFFLLGVSLIALLMEVYSVLGATVDKVDPLTLIVKP